MSHFVPEPRNFAEVTILPADFKKGLVENNFEIYQYFNHQSDVSNGLTIEERCSYTRYGCLQGKHKM